MEVFISTVFLIFLSFATIFAHEEITDDEKIDLSQYGWQMYGKPITNNHRMYIKRWGNPEERGPYLEGDLLNPNNPKNGIKHESFRWTNREIPYEISGRFSE